MNNFLGSVLEKITLTLGGTSLTRAMITGIVLKANNKPIFETTGARLEASNLYNGATTDATLLKLDFMDRKARTINAMQAGAIDLSSKSGIVSLRLEITIAGATAPTLVGLADVSPPVVEGSQADKDEAGIRQLICRRHTMTYVAAAAGTFALPIPHLDPSGGGSAYRRIYLYGANITSIKTIREGIAEHEVTKAQNEASQKDNFKVPQANLFVFDPTQLGQMQGSVWDTRPAVGVRSAQFLATFSAGETIVVETEELIGLGAY